MIVSKKQCYRWILRYSRRRKLRKLLNISPICIDWSGFDDFKRGYFS